MRQLSALLLMLALRVPLLASPATAYSLNVPSRQLSELVPSEGGALMRILLRDEQPGVDGVPTAKVVLRNGHSLWYVVTLRRAAVPGATLRLWVLLPPCRAEHATEYSCEGADAVLGRLPLRPGNELVLLGDGVASDELGRQVLGLIWAGELISRVGFQEPLPTNVGAALDALAWSAAAEGAEAVDPAYGALSVANTLREVEITDPLDLADAVARLGVEVGDAIDNPAVRAFLLHQGVSGEALNVASNVSGVVRTIRLGGSAGRVAADGGDRSTCAGRCGLWDGSGAGAAAHTRGGPVDQRRRSDDLCDGSRPAAGDSRLGDVPCAWW
jgi:hypothetical protein